MDEHEKLMKLAEYIHADRVKEPEIWHVGVPEEEPITLSLRGELETKNWQWYPESSEVCPEKASCCDKFKPGDTWKEHCTTMDHIITMLKENYPGEKLERQWRYYLEIIMRELSNDQ